MRKSTALITLALLGTGSLLASCGEEPVDTQAYGSVQDCVASGRYKLEECQKSYDIAKKDQVQNAPTFSRKEECEEQFGAGNCETRSQTNTGAHDSSSVFMPMMMGYMMGSMNNNGSTNFYPQPLYRDKERRYVNSYGGYVSRNLGSVKVTPSKLTPSYNSGTSAFGSKASTSVARGGVGRSFFSAGG